MNLSPKIKAEVGKTKGRHNLGKDEGRI